MDPLSIEKIPLLQFSNSNAKSPLFPNLEFTILSNNPPIVYIKNLLSSDECSHIINLASPKLFSSTMIINNQEVVNPSRSSRSAFIVPNGSIPVDDPVLFRLLYRISKLSGMPFTHLEGMKVVNYKKNQQYYQHHDFFGINSPFLENVGDRQMTFFIYLNDLTEIDGGATSFPNLNIKVSPSKGDALFWLNLDFHGKYFDDTIHAGEPVLTDTEKWGVNIWIRQFPYN